MSTLCERRRLGRAGCVGGFGLMPAGGSLGRSLKWNPGREGRVGRRGLRRSHHLHMIESPEWDIG